jgi:hypothetical protein
MFKSTAVLLFAIVALASASKVTFANCGNTTDPFVANSLDVSPFPITHGANTSIVIDGVANKGIEGGNFVISVYLGALPVFSKTQDFCQVIACPIKAGHQVVDYKYPIPSYAPAGVSITVHVQGQDLNKNELFCYKFDSKVLARQV